MIELTLPWPPTVNTYWRNFGGRTIVSAKGRSYRKACGFDSRPAHQLEGIVRLSSNEPAR